MKYIRIHKENSSTNNELYNVENIITRKIVGKRKLYLIKWEGYPIEESSWEPISNLSNVIYMVKEFEENYPSSINQKLVNEYIINFKKCKSKKFSNKKTNLKNRKNKQSSNNNKIIIILDDLEQEFNKVKEEEEKQSKIEFNYICEKKEKEINEKKINVNNVGTNNINNEVKLIRPIIIW